MWCCGVSPPKLGALVLSDLSVDHHDLPAYGFTELVGARYFRIEGDSGAEILHSLLLQKIPDVVIIGLLFFPWHRYFPQSK